MWETNKTVRYVYSTHGPEAVWAYFDGLNGWKRIRTGAADGVGNVAELLSTAKAHSRKVNVFIQSNQVERALML